jgi:hypothetical protein
MLVGIGVITLVREGSRRTGHRMPLVVGSSDAKPREEGVTASRRRARRRGGGSPHHGATLGGDARASSGRGLT